MSTLTYYDMGLHYGLTGSIAKEANWGKVVQGVRGGAQRIGGALGSARSAVNNATLSAVTKMQASKNPIVSGAVDKANAFMHASTQNPMAGQRWMTGEAFTDPVSSFATEAAAQIAKRAPGAAKTVASGSRNLGKGFANAMGEARVGRINPNLLPPVPPAIIKRVPNPVPPQIPGLKGVIG